MKKQIHAALYARVSTTDQSTELQRRELEAYAEARGWSVTWYEDKATGTNEKRPAFQALLKAAKSRQVDIILVWKLDRFARSLKSLVTHLHEFDEIGVQFVSLRDNIDLTTASGRLMMQMIGSFAEFEASIIRERVRAGVKAKIAKTGKWGPARKRDDQAILSLRQQGLSVRQIAKRLGISGTSVMRAIASVPGTTSKATS